MKSSIECVPCMVRQALEATGNAITDPVKREQVFRGILLDLVEMDFSQSPPAAAQMLHRRLRGESGVADPYRAAKERFNAMAMSLMPAFEEKIARFPDPFDAAVRLAIAGNVIDLGAKGDFNEDEAFAAMERAFDLPVEGDVGAFREAALSSPSILYLADNAGEIVFDRSLIRALPRGKVTVAVRGRPVINDATMEDAVVAGIPAMARVIENGSDAPGTILADCSREFVDVYIAADLVIAKGQGNYETLSDERKNIFFLFKVKCASVASHSGFSMGTHALVRSPG
ncbi:MAG: DUF89 family protein [Spirochaetes bacterium]|nr:DUF89 family protein [Spirochaetota bacterium]